METLIIILLLIAWLISPIVLTIMLILKNNELKRVREQLKNAVSNGSGAVNGNDSVMTETVVPVTEETVSSTVSPTAMPQNDTNAKSIYVQRAGSAAARANSDVETRSQESVIRQPHPGQVRRTQSGQAQARQPQPRPVRQPQPRPAVEKKQIPAGVWLFGIGILLVLMAGAIFATTTWAILPAAGKIAVLMMTVSVFYVAAFIAKKKLDLNNTSITFYILGSMFIAVINIAAGYFGWYGDYYTYDGGGILLIWSISALISSLCMIVGYIFYRTRVLGLLGYYFLLLTVLLGSCFAFDSVVPITLCIGVTLLITQLYSWLDRGRGGLDIVGKSNDIMCYLYAVYAFFLTMVYVGDDMNILLCILAIVTVAIAGIRLFCQAREEQFKFSIPGLIAGGMAILTLGFGCRFLEYFYLRLEVSFLIYLAIYVLITVLGRRGIYNNPVRWCVSVFSQLTIFAILPAHLIAESLRGVNAGTCFIILMAAVLYAIEHMNKENRTAVLSGLTFYSGIIYVITAEWMDDKLAVISAIGIAITVISVVLGRIIYKKVVTENENGILIDWISICSAIVLFTTTLISINDDTVGFIVLLVWGAYAASYYRRQNWIMDRICLTVAIAWTMFVIGSQQFIDIPKQIIIEWWIVIAIVATGLIGIVWRSYSKAYSFVWLAVTIVCFVAEYAEISVCIYGENYTAKMLAYLAGVAILFVFAFIRKNKVLTVEAGFAMLLFSVLSFEADAVALFVFALVMAVAYFIYLHYEGLSLFSFVPVAQLYVTVASFEPVELVWLIVFAAVVAGSYLLHSIWADGEKKELSDDILGVSAILPILAIWDGGDDKWCFAGIMMLALFVLSFYKRYSDDSQSMINKVILTVASLIVVVGWVNQPFMEMGDLAKTEWILFAFMAVCVFNMLIVYKHSTNDVWGWITFAVAIICVIVQAQCAIVKGEIIAALILGISMVLVLIWAYAAKKKQWFILSAITLIAQCIYASRAFWTSIAWWVYLLVAGALLITIAARSEYKKRMGIEEKRTENKHFLEGWQL